MKRFAQCFFILWLFFTWQAFAAKASTRTKIIGLHGDVLKNVKARLNEFEKTTSLNDETDLAINDQVTRAMMPYGYFSPDIRIQRQGKRFVIRITAGRPVIVTHVHLKLSGEGATDADLIAAKHAFAMKNGMVMNSVTYEEAKQALIDTASTKGYLNANYSKAEVLVDRASRTARITLVFETGQKYYFGQVQFSPSYISKELLHRFVPFQYGQVFSAPKIIEFNDVLSGTGYFSEAAVNPDIGDERFVPIHVALKDTSRFNYYLGVGYGTDTGPRGRAGVQIVPVNSSGHKFNVISIGSTRQNIIQGQYLIPGKNPLTDEYTFTGNYSNLDYYSGHSNSLMFSAAMRHHAKGFERSLSINALAEQFNYQLLPVNVNQWSVFPKVNLMWDNVGSDLFAPTGYRIRATALAASKAILSGISFAQGVFDARGAITVPFLRTRFYGHVIQGITATGDIFEFPLSLAILLGGADNLKGYSFNSIGPGKRVSFGGIEIQKETVDNWYVVGFYDIGNVYDPTPSFWQRDIGAGLMWVSPLGPIKMGVAQAIDQDFRRLGRERPRLVVSMGPDI